MSTDMESTDDIPFSVSCHDDLSAVALVVAEGELDIASSDGLREVFGSPEAQASTVVLDLRLVTFIDSCGLSAIVAQDRRAKQAGERFVVATGGAPQVQRLIALTGLGDLLESVEKPEDVFADRRDGATEIDRRSADDR